MGQNPIEIPGLEENLSEVDPRIENGFQSEHDVTNGMEYQRTEVTVGYRGNAYHEVHSQQ